MLDLIVSVGNGYGYGCYSSYGDGYGGNFDPTGDGVGCGYNNGGYCNYGGDGLSRWLPEAGALCLI